MFFLDKLSFALVGPFWPEYLVAKELRNKGWTVYRHFHCSDPVNAQYAEIDVLGISKDGFIIVEVKSYSGDWYSLDHHSRPMWKKGGRQDKFKSPVWQVRRARLALINSVLQAYPSTIAKILDCCRTYVFLDRGEVLNASEAHIAKAWADMNVQVLRMSQRDVLPVASAPASAAFLDWLDSYHRHFRWRLHYKLLWKLRLLDARLKKVSRRWAERPESRQA